MFVTHDREASDSFADTYGLGLSDGQSKRFAFSWPLVKEDSNSGRSSLVPLELLWPSYSSKSPRTPCWRA